MATACGGDGNDEWGEVGEGSAVRMMDYEGEMKVREREKHLILSLCICPHYLQELSKREQARQEIEGCQG